MFLCGERRSLEEVAFQLTPAGGEKAAKGMAGGGHYKPGTNKCKGRGGQAEDVFGRFKWQQTSLAGERKEQRSITCPITCPRQQNPQEAKEPQGGRQGMFPGCFHCPALRHAHL